MNGFSQRSFIGRTNRNWSGSADTIVNLGDKKTLEALPNGLTGEVRDKPQYVIGLMGG